MHEPLKKLSCYERVIERVVRQRYRNAILLRNGEQIGLETAAVKILLER